MSLRLRKNRVNQGKKFHYTLAGEGRQADDRNVREERHSFLNCLYKRRISLRGFFYNVPFIQCNYTGFASAFNICGNMGVLRSHTSYSIWKRNSHIAVLNTL